MSYLQKFDVAPSQKEGGKWDVIHTPIYRKDTLDD